MTKDILLQLQLFLASFILLVGVSWGLGKITNLEHFFMAVGLGTSAATCYWLVYHSAKKMGLGLSWAKGKYKFKAKNKNP